MKIPRMKVLNFIGYILSIACIYYIYDRLKQLDWSQLSMVDKPKVILAIVVTTFTYTLFFMLMGWAWKGILEGTKKFSISIPTPELIEIYMRANLGKYLPGNVMEFVFRNFFTVKYGFSHQDVALASVAELILSLVVAGIMGIPAIYFFSSEISSTAGIEYVVYSFCAVSIVGAAVVFFLRKKLEPFFNSIKNPILQKKYLVAAFVFVLLFINMAGSLIFYLVSIFGVGIDGMQALAIGSIFTFAWIIGTVTPGAPGGLGIKEAFTLILSSQLGVSHVLAPALVLHRLVSIIGDVFAFVLIWSYRRIYKT